MKVLYLFSRSRIPQAEKLARGEGHDNHFIGMFRIRKYGIETDFLDPEHVLPAWAARRWRKVFNILWMHAPFLLKMRKYDIAFANAAHGTLLIKALLGLKRPKWVIYDTNVTGAIGKADTLRRKLFKFAVSRAEGIVTLSQAEKESLQAMFPETKDRYEFLYEGVDTAHFTPSTEPDGDYILSVGLDPGRDFKTLIAAMKELPQVNLIIATKPERVRAYEPLPPNVSAKLYPAEMMRDLYAKARCVVISLNMKDDGNDSMGTYAVIEAMASGKAVIATRTKSLESYIEDGVSGLLVPKHDVNALREAVRTLVGDPKKCRELGDRAREFVVRHADAEMFARELARFLKKIHTS